MRNKKAKAIRRVVYGDNVTNAMGRKYFRSGKTGQIVADAHRRTYQQVKKAA